MTISYMGFTQAIIAIIIVLMKKPLKIADIILSVLLFSFVLLFGINLLQVYNVLTVNDWIYTLSVSMAFAPLLYLYSKYITKEHSKFQKNDFLHAIPNIVTLLLFCIFNIIEKNNYKIGESTIAHVGLRNVLGLLYLVQIITYSIYSLRIVRNSQKQLKNYYSYSSDKNNLNWMKFIVISFLLIYILNFIHNTLIEMMLTKMQFDFLRNISNLIFMFIITVWGSKQQQLFSENKVISEYSNDEIVLKIDSGKYVHSSLKNSQAKEYILQLQNYMEQTQAWKDSELSLNKLSVQTKIPKHHISQLLNEVLNKNFYGFVNEYRVEYAKKLLTSKEFNHWSIVAIAEESGFNSKAAFNNFFKKNTNLTPSEYKKTIK